MATMLTNICFFLSLMVVGTRCQLNVTDSPILYNETEVNDVTEPSLPPFWCPPPYTLNTGLQLCRRLSCFFKASRFNVSSETKNVAIHNETHHKICPHDGRFDPYFKSSECRRVRLSPKDFYINYTDYTLYEIRTNTSHNLGNFSYDSATGEASICRDQVLDNDDTDDVFISCMPYKPKVTDYTVLQNESIYLTKIKRLVRPSHYQVSGYTKNRIPIIETVCLEISRSVEICEESLGELTSNKFKLNPDLSLFTNNGEEITLPLGDYVLTDDHSFAIYCVNAGEARRPVTRHLYASAFVVSAAFLFITLVVHLLYPSLNYHARALLCHILSLFIMYVTMAIQTLENYYPTQTARYVLFSVTYVSALAAFFWLNVLAYELYRVFSSVHAAPGGFGPQRENRRLFLIKCGYAWGIPIILCCLTIGLAHNPGMAELLDLTLATDNMVWFNTSTSKLVFFYLPIIMILIENCIFFGITVWSIKKASKGTQMINKKVSKQLFRVFVKLFIVMGIFWFAEVISWLLEKQADEAVWYATDLINALQGVAVFVVYVFKKSTWKILKKKWNGNKKGSKSSKSTSSTGDSNGKHRKISNISNTEITMTNMNSVQNN